MISRTCLTAASIALLIPAAHADDSPPAADKRRVDALDIIPADAFGAIAIRDVADLAKRGDRFIAKTELSVPMRLSEAYRFVTMALGIRGGLDEKGAAALILMGPEAKEDTLVLAVPVADFGAMAANFGLTRERLVEGKVVDRKEFQDISSNPYVRYLSVRKSHLLMGGDSKLVELAATGKTLRTSLPKLEETTFAKDDIFLYGRPGEEIWGDSLHGLKDELDDLPDNEAEALRQVVAALDELKYAAIGVRLDDGLAASVALQFNGEKSRGILARLQGGQSKTSLAGLPKGRVLAAHASSGDGDKSAAVARAFLHFLLRTFSVKTDEFVSAGLRPNVVGVFGEVWQRLNGSRTALYENANPSRDGLFSLIAVLETDDAEQFVADMTGLARFINASGLSPDDVGDTINVESIRKLIGELGHDEYRVRQMATTKLGLVGKSALPALEQAMKSNDVEVSFRARAVSRQINESLAAEREDLLKRDLLSRIKPNFIYFPKQETRSGRPVEFVRLQLQIDEAPTAERLRNLLGPDWSKMRLATVDNRVILLLGSNTSLLDKAIANARSGDAGIESGTRYAKFRSRAQSQRTVEFHLSLARAQQLVARVADPAGVENEVNSATSFGLSIAPQRIRFDLFVPFEEVKVVVKRMGW